MRRMTCLALCGMCIVATGCKAKEHGVDVSNVNGTVTTTSGSGVEETTTAGMEEGNMNLSFDGNSVVETKTEKDMNFGNTTGNLVNSGIVCEAGGKIYYFNKNDDKKLYAMNLDGSDKESFDKIQGAMELNYGGDYLYYQAGGIYRVKLKDKSVETLVENNCRNMVVADATIYYVHNDNDINRIHCMNLDGSMDQVLTENTCNALNVDGSYIYYINNSDSGKIYRMKLDGSEEECLASAKKVQELLVDKSFIYYVSNSSDGNHVYRLPKNGGEAKEIIKDSCSNLNMNGGLLYYYNASKDTLCYSNSEGAEEKVLYSGKLNAVNVISNWVYFFNLEDYQYYRIGKDGNNIEVVE